MSERLIASQALDHTFFYKNCRGQTFAKSIDLQIMQRDLQQLPHNLSCSVRLCRKSLNSITTSPSRRSFVLRHFPCIIPICVTTNRSEMEGVMPKRAGLTQDSAGWAMENRQLFFTP